MTARKEFSRQYEADGDSYIAKAFNMGCDAYLAGKSLDDNPFKSTAKTGDNVSYRAWKEGWHDIDNNWNNHAKKTPRFNGPHSRARRDRTPDS